MSKSDTPNRDPRAVLYAGNITAAMHEHDEMTRQELVAALVKLGYPVSEQAVGAWLRAEYAPRPTHQAAIARVFRIPVHVLFPVTLDLAA